MRSPKPLSPVASITGRPVANASSSTRLLSGTCTADIRNALPSFIASEFFAPGALSVSFGPSFAIYEPKHGQILHRVVDRN